MQPRVRTPNAGRSRAFLRGASPRAEPFPGAGEGGAGASARAPAAAADKGDPGRAETAAPADLGDLRRAVAAIEGRLSADARLAGMVPEDPGRGRVALGAASIDGLFAGGGLPLGALVDVRAAETRGAGAATGFVAALCVRIGALRRGPLLWVVEGRARLEAGRPAALGLLHLGLDPARLLVVEVREAADALWAIEEGLGCPGLSAVVGELHGLPKALDLTASRRLALRAREGGVPVLLAGHAMPEAASAAAVRLAVAPRLSRPADGFADGPGFPAWTIAVEKNRDGRTGRVDLEWNSDERRFRALEPAALPLAATPVDRPAGPAAAGQVLAGPGAGRGWRRAS